MNLKKLLSQNLLFYVIIAVVCALGLTISFMSTDFDYDNFPKAESAVLDISKHNFDDISLLKIEGNVEFYYNQLLTPDNIDDTAVSDLTGYIEISDIWNSYQINGEPIGGFGYATYRFNLITDSTIGQYAFKIYEFVSSYKMWVNGVLVVECGKVADNKEDYIPSWKHNEVYFPTKKPDNEIIIQVANFHHRKGGTEGDILIGKSESVLKNKINQLALNYLLVGILATMGFYHFVLFFYRKSDKSIFYFGLFNIVILVRMMLTGEKVFVDLFPFVPWVIYVRLEYISLMLSTALFIYFLYSLFPKDFSKKISKSIAWISIAFSAIVVFTPPVIFTHTILPFHLVIAFVCIYSLAMLGKVTYLKKEYSAIILAGCMVLLLIVINDILHYNKLIGTSYSMPVGLIAVIISQAFVLSKKTARAFANAEVLSGKLELYSLQLEGVIDKRTKEIEEKKAKLLAKTVELEHTNKKLVELDSFRETVSHMIVHDLKNPLNVIMTLSENKMIKLAGRQMLNMIKNILDVNKYGESKLDTIFEKKLYSDVIKKIIDQHEILIKQKEVDLVLVLREDYRFEYDEALVERILSNLLSNAVKFTAPEGKIILEVNFENNHVKTAVTNYGEVIEETDRGKVFGKYQQIKRKDGEYGKSYGLGLAFCKMASEAHNGTIDFISGEQTGTTFWFTLEFKNGTKETTDSSDIVIPKKLVLNQNLISDADKEYLSEFANLMSKYSLIQSSKIVEIIGKIDYDHSYGVSMWIDHVKASIDDYDANMYMDLLKVIQY